MSVVSNSFGIHENVDKGNDKAMQVPHDCKKLCVWRRAHSESRVHIHSMALSQLLKVLVSSENSNASLIVQVLQIPTAKPRFGPWAGNLDVG